MVKTKKKPTKTTKVKKSTKKSIIKDPISKDLFDILACPVCKSDLKYNPKKTGLLCSKCKAGYPIKDGIPILLPPELQ